MPNLLEPSAFGDLTTQAIETNLAGSPVPADIGQIFIGNTVQSADAITIDSGANFPPGIAFRRYLGTPAEPELVTPGTQLGYLDFRGYSGTQMWNNASLDVVVSGEALYADGEIPPTKMRFSTAFKDHPVVHMELLARGRLEIGAIDGEVYHEPSSTDPKLFAVSTKSDWVASFAARPAAGAAFAIHCETNGETENDYLIGGISGVSPTLKFSVRGNGDVLTSGVLKVNDTQVVGAQGAAVADATDAASVITQLNTLLARLREHGLIAT